MNIDPTRQQFDAFKALPRDTPVNMLNLVRLRVEAAYEDGRTATGAEAYAAYGRESAPVFQRVGGTITWRGAPEAVLIGPADERWDIAFIARYPSGGAFLEMVTDPAPASADLPRRRSTAPRPVSGVGASCPTPGAALGYRSAT